MIPKLLIAEPDEFFSKFYRLKFFQAGFEVENVRDGLSTQKKISENTYQAILINLKLPKKNGFEIITEIKNSPNSSTPLFIVTELRQEVDKKKAEKLGVQHYFIKNEIQIEELISIIKSTIGYGEQEEKNTEI